MQKRQLKSSIYYPLIFLNIIIYLVLLDTLGQVKNMITFIVILVLNVSISLVLYKLKRK